MCGISIAINKRNESVSREQIKLMNDKVSHRGPDAEGFFHGNNFAFGHRRLSIIDLSDAGRQPMQRNQLQITYNGEVYNYLELRAELKNLGHTFSTQTDTEVIMAAYEEWGLDCFERLNGMWAFAIYDESKNEVILSRDHFGIKPLYFYQNEGWFLASSEIKQFTVFDDFVPKLNKVTAINFLASGWLNYSDETFFEGVNELRPGHYLVYNLSTHQQKIHQWYNLKEVIKLVNDDYPVAVEKVRKLFTESVRIRMRSDVRVGSCLSGGIDSSSIVVTIHEQDMANPDFMTITSCYENKKYDEQKFSDQVTSQTGFTSKKVFPNLDNLLDAGDLDRMIFHMDQPFGGASHYSEFNVFKKAREENVIVMQDGQGSDEYFCGYGEFFTLYLSECLRTFKWRKAFDLMALKAKFANTSFLSQLAAYIRSNYYYTFLGLLKKISGRKEYPWLNSGWEKLAKETVKRFQEKNVLDQSIMEIMYSSIPYQLHSEDRNAMLFSIESRLPFLDHRLVEYGIGLPTSYKIKDGYTKAVLRDAIKELPPEIRNRKDKMGFVAPDAPWMIQNKDRIRKELHTIVNEMDIFSEDLLTRFDCFVSGDLGYEGIYFRAYAFGRFCKLFNISVEKQS